MAFVNAGPCLSLPGVQVQVPGPGSEKLEELGGGVFARVGQNRRNGVGIAEGHAFGTLKMNVLGPSAPRNWALFDALFFRSVRDLPIALR
jgi:hypothetical protein